MKKHLKKLLTTVTTGSAALLSSAPVWALDVTPTGDVATAITGAQTSASTVGGYVVAAVASLIVVGLVITMVRKL